MLEVFKSRWITHLSWRCATPRRSCFMRHLTSAALKAWRSNKVLNSCSAYSITMKMWRGLLPTTTSRSLTTFGWSIFESNTTSRRDAAGKPSSDFDAQSFSCFSATISPVSASRAQYTTPYVPSSMRLSLRKPSTLRQPVNKRLACHRDSVAWPASPSRRFVFLSPLGPAVPREATAAAVAEAPATAPASAGNAIAGDNNGNGGGEGPGNCKPSDKVRCKPSDMVRCTPAPSDGIR
mmetsp:Transcript_99556/g.280903  ORF Transcript_99556/g.280903 Transcript_99556/m.280903 type:complete len:236 (-) Transcript_99556:421-1128(-)